MNRKSYNLAVKTVCFLLLLFTLVGTVANVVGVCYMASHGFYTQSADAILDEELYSRVVSLGDDIANAYAQETLASTSQELLERGWGFYNYDGANHLYPQAYTGQSNYRYEIRDEAGNLLKGNYNQEPVLATSVSEEASEYMELVRGDLVWRSGGTYRVTGYVLQNLEYEDEFFWQVKLVRDLYSYRYTAIVLAVVCLVALICLLVYLLSAAGHRPGRDEIVLNLLDRIPTDLYLTAAVLGIGGLWQLFYDSTYWSDTWVSVVLAPCCLALAGMLITGFLMSLATRCKYGHGYWWRHSILGGAALLLLRALKWLGRGIRSLYRMLPIIWRWLVIGLVLWLLVLFTRNPYGNSTPFLLVSLIGAALICYSAWSFGKLRTAASRMASGKLQEKLDISRLHGAYREMGENLSALGQGVNLAVDQQLKSERMKTELITNVSHDIKTPLTSIINYVDLLQKPHTPEQSEVYLEVLARQSQRLKKLIEDLVEMSKATTGNIPVDLVPTNVVELVNQALAEYETKLNKARLTAVCTVGAEEIPVLSDGRLFWRVMDNLLGNIIKYAQPDTRVYIDVVKYEKKVMISLKNVSRERLNLPPEELMERFVRGDKARNTEGSGLGLNIAKTLTELQKGRLNLVIDGDLFKAVLLFDVLPPSKDAQQPTA